MKKIVLLITIQILCMHSFVVNAQRIFSTSYTMDDGLAANRVYSILMSHLLLLDESEETLTAFREGLAKTQ